MLVIYCELSQVFAVCTKKSKLQDKRQADRNEQLAITSRITKAETIEIPGRDMHPMRTMTMIDSTRPGFDVEETHGQSVRIVTHTAVDVAGSGHSSCHSDMNTFCEYNLRSFREDELRASAEVSEESIAQIIGGPFPSSVFDAAASSGGDFEGQAKAGCVHSRSTTVKIPRATSCDVPASRLVFGESPIKRTAEVAFTPNVEEPVVGGI